MTIRLVFLVISVFLASTVEFVEALTIVMAVGVTRQWRSTLLGVLTGVVALAVVVGIFGTALVVFVPLNALRLVVGAFLLVFGLQWVRKAIMRASGRKALHDESLIFEKQRALAATQQSSGHGEMDWYSFTVATKGVFLEGLEVAFIVVTFGSNAQNIPLAVLGALAAGIMVISAGIALRRPLSAVPENTMKFIVGLMLTTFGTFWAGEGVGVNWPGSDLAILVILAGFGLLAWLAVKAARPPKMMTPHSTGVGSLGGDGQ